MNHSILSLLQDCKFIMQMMKMVQLLKQGGQFDNLACWLGKYADLFYVLLWILLFLILF